jgi:hypothetical protein
VTDTTPLDRLILEVSEKRYPVLVDDVKDWIIKNAYQEEIHFFPYPFDMEVLKGHIRKEQRSVGVYTDTLRVANILYCESMTRCWKRFVCCKEMLHIFDKKQESTQTLEEINRLTASLATPPPVNPSMDYKIDLITQYRALFVLAPLKTVNFLHEEYMASDKKSMPMAQKLLIPDHWVDFVFSDEYFKAHQILTNLY